MTFIAMKDGRHFRWWVPLPHQADDAERGLSKIFSPRAIARIVLAVTIVFLAAAYLLPRMIPGLEVDWIATFLKCMGALVAILATCGALAFVPPMVTVSSQGIAVFQRQTGRIHPFAQLTELRIDDSASPYPLPSFRAQSRRAARRIRFRRRSIWPSCVLSSTNTGENDRFTTGESTERRAAAAIGGDAPMNMRKPMRIVLTLAILLGVYPAFVLGYSWSCVLRSDFHGGRHGPLDAYRHALASSVVAYTLNESAVDLITILFESKGKDSNRMDEHNNRIGANLGAHADSFRELEPAVRQLVANGAADAAKPDQITWLPENKWRDGWIW